MNWDNIEGNWEQMKGKVRETWGKLTDDDLAVIRGKRQQLAGKLQDKYGYVKEKAEEEIERFLKSDSCSSTKDMSGKSKDSCCN